MVVRVCLCGVHLDIVTLSCAFVCVLACVCAFLSGATQVAFTALDLVRDVLQVRMNATNYYSIVLYRKWYNNVRDMFQVCMNEYTDYHLSSCDVVSV